MNGVVVVMVVGGLGEYFFVWLNGEMGLMVMMLFAGEEVCVQVIDENDCIDEVCFIVEFIIVIIFIFENDMFVCNGNIDGVIIFFVENGVLFYDYSWINGVGILNGMG